MCFMMANKQNDIQVMHAKFFSYQLMLLQCASFWCRFYEYSNVYSTKLAAAVHQRMLPTYFVGVGTEDETIQNQKIFFLVLFITKHLQRKEKCELGTWDVCCFIEKLNTNFAVQTRKICPKKKMNCFVVFRIISRNITRFMFLAHEHGLDNKWGEKKSWHRCFCKENISYTLFFLFGFFGQAKKQQNRNTAPSGSKLPNLAVVPTVCSLDE